MPDVEVTINNESPSTAVTINNSGGSSVSIADGGPASVSIENTDPDAVIDIGSNAGVNVSVPAASILSQNYQEFATSSARSNATPDFIGQPGRQTRGGSWFIGRALSAGSWDWTNFGTFTPASSTTYAAGNDYAVGDLVKVTGSNVVWECIVAISNASSPTDDPGVSASWTVYFVEDYHYTLRDPFNGITNVPKKVKLGDPSRAEDWSKISDEAWKLLPEGGNYPGADAKWGVGYNRLGILELSEGVYSTSAPIKHICDCVLTGADPYSYERTTISASDSFTGGNYLVDGVFRNGVDGDSSFFTKLKNLFVNCREVAKRGVFFVASSGGEITDVALDGYTEVGVHVGNGTDEFTATRVNFLQLLRNTVSNFCWWFDDDCKSVTINQTSFKITHCGMSFGATPAINIFGVDMENSGLLFEFRHKNSGYIDGSPGDYPGRPNACNIHGIRALRNSNNVYGTDQGRTLGKVRVATSGGGFYGHTGLIISGKSDDTGSANEPYDRISVQENNGTPFNFPLRWDLGYDFTTVNSFAFYFDLDKMLYNTRFRSTYTKMQDSRLVSINNPATQTSASGAISIALEPGTYRIELPSGNTYGDDYTVTIRSSVGGTAIPNGSSLNSQTNLYYEHPGGNMEWEVSGSSGTPSINIYFRPWFL